MACNAFSRGFRLPCVTIGGGVKAIGIIPFEQGLINFVDGKLSAIPSEITEIYRYEMKSDTNIYVQTQTTDPEARTLNVAGSLTVIMNGVDVEVQQEVEQLGRGEVIIFLELNNGEIMVAGANFGALMITGELTTGTLNAFSGFTLTFETNEATYAGFLDGSAKTDYVTLLVRD